MHKNDQINKEDETLRLSNILSDYSKKGCSTSTHIENQESEITFDNHHLNNSGSDSNIVK